MRTLAPAQLFLRVVDKFFAAFALDDQELCSGATLLYLNLFRLAGQRDACAPSQAALARACKSSERTVQHYLRQLTNLGYIRIERDGTHNVYRLLFSARVRELAGLIGLDLVTPSAKGEDSSPSYPQNTARRGEEFSHSIRNKRIRQKLPLSPSPVQPPTPLASSPRKTPPCQGGCVPLREAGEGDSCSLSSLQTLSTSNPTPPLGTESGPNAGGGSAAPDHGESKDGRGDFERLFAAWPLKKDKLNASRMFASLVRSGALPPMNELLATVERFKTEDRSWRNGYVPNLRFWLQGHRWTDEIRPVIPTAFTRSDPLASVPAVPADPEAQAHLAACAAQARAIQEQCYAKKEESSELTATVDSLARLWPEEPRQKLFSRLLTARLRGASLSDVARKALDWTGTLPPPGEWFNLAVA